VIIFLKPFDQSPLRLTTILALSLLVTLFVVVTKSHGFPAPAATLWAEDGNIFLSQASELGIRSLFTPYAGYLHLWPRMFAYLSSWLPANMAPALLFAGWCCAFALMTGIVLKRLTDYQVAPVLVVAFTCLAGLQPTTHETFFTITNAQWFLAIGLFFYVILEGNTKNGLIDYLTLALLCLTGPFCIILAPFALVKILLKKGMVDRFFYSVFFISATLQVLIIATVGRASSGPMSLDPHAWVMAAKIFLLFGAEITLLPVAFWTTVAGGTIYLIRKHPKPASEHLWLTTMLVLGAFALYLSGLWSSKHAPSMISPLGGGARYYVPAYGIIFITIPFLFRLRPYVALPALATMIMLCWQLYLPFNREDVQYQAYTEFSKAKSGVFTPINPVMASFPGWGIPGHSLASGGVSSYEYNLKDLAANSEDVSHGGSGRLFDFKAEDPQILLTYALICPDARYIGISISVNRSLDGWAQLFWADDKGFREKHSLRRYYPAGESTMDFAFPNHSDGIKVRLDPSEVQGATEVRSIKVYCLPG
jgi:hypothetical protein